MKANSDKSHILKSKNYKPSVKVGNVTIVNSENNDSKEVNIDKKLKYDCPVCRKACKKLVNWLLSADIDDLQQSIREDEINKTHVVALQVFYKYKLTLKKLLQKEDSATFHTEYLKTLVVKIITAKSDVKVRK